MYAACSLLIIKAIKAEDDEEEEEEQSKEHKTFSLGRQNWQRYR